VLLGRGHGLGRELGPLGGGRPKSRSESQRQGSPKHQTGEVRQPRLVEKRRDLKKTTGRTDRMLRCEYFDWRMIQNVVTQTFDHLEKLSKGPIQM
jgi:hypothetical protein